MRQLFIVVKKIVNGGRGHAEPRGDFDYGVPFFPHTANTFRPFRESQPSRLLAVARLLLTELTLFLRSVSFSHVIAHVLPTVKHAAQPTAFHSSCTVLEGPCGP